MSYLTRHQGPFFRISGHVLEAKRLVGALDDDELRMLVEIVKGASLRDVAVHLGIAESQAEAVRSNILRKFRVGTTADLIRIGLYAEVEALSDRSDADLA